MGQTIRSASLIALMAFGAFGQDAPARLVFEVASVKASKGEVRGASADFSEGGNRFTATNMPLGGLILMAYNITVRQLSGPGPVLSERYDVAAKAERSVSRDQMLRMLEALLVDRFKLALHRESKEVPVYALVVGRGGPKLHPSDAAKGEGANPRTPSRAGGSEPKSGHLIFKNESMSDFAWALSRVAGIGDRVVLDNTGLEGRYDFELTFERGGTPPVGAEAREPATSLEGPSIFETVQEQLGLKLESKKGAVEFLVVDSVDRPSAN
jgi:uncharacterized protein (TIGR03435 family)